jgi:hypothetical protein
VILVQHVFDDTPGRYAMQTLPEPDAGPLVEHLVVCQSCRDRLTATDPYVVASRIDAADRIANATPEN